MKDNLLFDRKQPNISADSILEDITIGNWSLMKDNYVKAVQYYIEKSKHFDRVYEELLKEKRELTRMKARLFQQMNSKCNFPKDEVSIKPFEVAEVIAIDDEEINNE